MKEGKKNGEVKEKRKKEEKGYKICRKWKDSNFEIIDGSKNTMKEGNNQREVLYCIKGRKVEKSIRKAKRKKNGRQERQNEVNTEISKEVIKRGRVESK